MKRLLLLSFLIISVSETMASARVIEKPASLYQSTFGRLHIDAVTMTDKATTLNLTVLKFEDVFFLSHLTCLRDVKGRTYSLRQIVSDYDLRPDEPKLFKEMGSNRLAVKLVFEPLPADVAEVDMTDPLFFNRGVFGLRLDGSPLPPLKLPDGVKERLAEIMARQDTLPSVDYRFGWATVKGHLLEYRPGMGSRITMLVGHPSTFPRRHCDTLCAEVTPSGDFTFRLPVAHITPVMLELLREEARGVAYVGPDTETEIYVNMRELSYRNLYIKADNATKLYVTKGPLAQLANELNQHLFMYRLDFDEQHFNTLFSDKEEWEHFKEIEAMLPTKQLEVRMAKLDTLKVERQWSPAMKELVRLYWQMKTAQLIRLIPSNELEKEARVSLEAQKRLIAWQRDAVVAELNTYNQLINNPKQLYCPEFIYLTGNNNNISTLLPDFVANEKKVWKLRQQMDDFSLLDPDEMADYLANLPSVYRQLVLAWQNIYREEQNRLAATPFDCDTLTLQGIPDTLIVQTLRERYRGHTLFIHFWSNTSIEFMHNVVFPLQRELKDLDIVWVTVYTEPVQKDNKKAMWAYAKFLRYGIGLQGEHYYYKMSSHVDRLLALNKTMGIKKLATSPFCIVSPEGRIIRNSEDWSTPSSNRLAKYLAIRHCLLKYFAMTKTIQKLH